MNIGHGTRLSGAGGNPKSIGVPLCRLFGGFSVACMMLWPGLQALAACNPSSGVKYYLAAVIVGPDTVCVGANATFSVTVNGPVATYAWSGGDSPSSGTSASYTTKWNTAGAGKVVSVTVVGSDPVVPDGDCKAEDTHTVCVVEVLKVQYEKNDGTYADGPGHVCLGSEMTLKAVPNPCHFPLNSPDWSVVSKPTGATVADVDLSDGYSVITIPAAKLGAAGEYKFSAACGTSSKDITMYVLKVDLDGDNEDDGDVDDEDDAEEENLPVIVAINEDTRELTVRKVGVSSGGTLKIKKTGAGKITLKKSGGATVLGESDSESIDILADAGTADLVLTLDGIDVGDVDLELEFAAGGFSCSDPFKVKVVRSDIVQRSGNTFLAALIGEARTHSGVHWEKYVTDLYDPGIERISLATYESLADGGPDKKRLRLKKTLYMARRVWAKVYDDMDAQAYPLPTSAHPWNLFTTSTNYLTANCNELVTEQFRRAITEVRGELTKPSQQTAFESAWYAGGAASPLAAGKHLVLFPGESPMAGPTIFVMETALNFCSKCVGATTLFQNDYEGEILIFFYNPYTATRYTAGSSCSICATSYPTAPWYVIPFLDLWDEAHHSTVTPDSFVGSSFFEEITY